MVTHFSSILFILGSLCFLIDILSLSQVLGQQVADVHVPDVSLIGEMGDVAELGRLVQLVLGCAVSCEKKQGNLGYQTAVQLPLQIVKCERSQECLSSDELINSCWCGCK